MSYDQRQVLNARRTYRPCCDRWVDATHPHGPCAKCYRYGSRVAVEAAAEPKVDVRGTVIDGP